MKHPRSNKGSLRQAIAPIIDRLEDRRLLSAVFESAGGISFSAGGHGVTRDHDSIVNFLSQHGRVTTIGTQNASSMTTIPAGATSFLSEDLPTVVAFDTDGLYVTEQDDSNGPSPFEPPPLIPGLPGTGSGTDSGVVAASLSRPSVEEAIAEWRRSNPGYVDEDGLLVTPSLPDDLARQAASLLFKAGTGSNGRQLGGEYPSSGELPVNGLRPAGVGSGLNIVLNKSSALSGNAAASASFDRAAAYVETLFDDPVTIYIDADVSQLGLNGSGGEIVGSTQPVYKTGVTYSDLRTRLTADNSATETIVDSLPAFVEFAYDTGTSFSTGTFQLTNANALSLGLMRASSASAYGGPRKDGTIQFDIDQPFDFTNSDGLGSGKTDFFSTAVHEIFHLLGFVSVADTVDYLQGNGVTSGTISPAPLDLFRLKPVASRQGFSAAPRILSTGNGYPYPVFFDGSFAPTGISGFGTTLSTGDVPASTGVYLGDGRQASHFKDNSLIGRVIGIMDPTIRSTPVIENLRAIDQKLLGLIGWDVSTSGAVLGDDGVLRVNGTGDANTIVGSISTNSTGLKAFTASISGAGVTVPAYFNNAEIGRVDYSGFAGIDTITGTTKDEYLYGGDAGDTIDAGGGDDYIDGGAGDDTGLAGGSGEDTIVGNSGSDTIGGGAGTDTLLGGLSDDYIEGGTENDLIKGEGGIDGLYGNDGNDTFDAVDQIVDTAINGGPGSDTAYYDASPSEASKLSSIENGIPS